MIRHALRYLAILSPLLGVLWFWYGADLGRRGSLVELAITGYDPIDLLSGHYVRYRIDFGPLDVCKEGDNYLEEERCVCLQPAPVGELTKVTRATECAAIGAGCNKYLRGVCANTRFEAGVEQFYIPEIYAPLFATLPDKSSIVIALTGEGEAQVVDLKVGGVPFREYVKR